MESFDQLLTTALETVRQHAPQQAAWLPPAVAGGVILVALVLMTRGARLAPVLVSVLFLGLGAWTGWFASQLLLTPFWPTVIATSLVGAAVGAVLAKLWMAVLLAGAFIAAALTLYSVQVIAPNIDGASTVDVYAVQLPTVAEGPVAETADAVLLRIWQRLAAEVPNFRTSIWAILLSLGLAGLIFGLLLPKVTRVLLTSTAGTLLLLASGWVVLKTNWPEAVSGVESLGAWGWAVITGPWLLSLLVNGRHASRRRPVAEQPEEEPAAEVAAT